MKVRITGAGIFGADGELAVGSVVSVAKEPVSWAGRYQIVDDGTEPAQEKDDASLANPVAVTNPAENPIKEELVMTEAQINKMNREEVDQMLSDLELTSQGNLIDDRKTIIEFMKS